MGRKRKLLAAGLGGVVAAATAFQLTRLAYEESDYEVVERSGGLEVRRYPARVVAQTTVRGDEAQATSPGFGRLAGYIFGGNDGGRDIAMTTPVERAPAEGARIAMTTPVERAPSDDGWVITFTMPSEHDVDSLPRPNDERVTVREVPAETVAVLRFSGRADVSTRQRHTERLLRKLRERGYAPTGEARLAQYDPPWVLGPFRRNEILVPVEPAS